MTCTKHKRRSIRLKGWEYSDPGYYFVTLCVQGKKCLFGNVNNDEMKLNNVGKMIKMEWYALKKRYKQIELDEFVIMPNHLHGIVQIKRKIIYDDVGAPIVGAQNRATTRVAPTKKHGENRATTRVAPTKKYGENWTGTRVAPTKKYGENWTGTRVAPTTNDTNRATTRVAPTTKHGENRATTRVAPTTLGNIIGAFKSITTNQYIQNVKKNNWPRFNKRLWQRNYWEHIIGSEKSYYYIKEYIINNPNTWEKDILYI